MAAEYYTKDGGIHFDPEDEQVIKEYLIPKSQGRACIHGGFIAMKNVYAKEPWLLDHTNNPFLKENEWYYFVTRTQVSKKNIGFGKMSKRKIAAGDNNDGGSWKANWKKDITDKMTREIIGVKKYHTFTRSNNNSKNKKQKREDGASCSIVPGSDSSWNMTEYAFPEGDKFQELVICKIREIKNKDGRHGEASTSTYQTLSLVETVPERSPEKDAQVDGMDDWTGELMYKYTSEGLGAILMTNTEDQKQPPISAPAHLGDKSQPMELDEHSKEDEELDAAVSALTLDEKDAPNLQWMDQDEDQQQPPILPPSHMDVFSHAFGVKCPPVYLDGYINYEGEDWTIGS